MFTINSVNMDFTVIGDSIDLHKSVLSTVPVLGTDAQIAGVFYIVFHNIKTNQDLPGWV